MPRQERIKSGMGIYYVMLRGINRQDTFEDDEESLQMTDCLYGLTERYDENGIAVEPPCTLYSYCLMIRSLKKSRRNYILKSVKEYGAGMRQLSRLTGVSYGYKNDEQGGNDHRTVP